MKWLALVALAGCASYGTMTTARPVEPGASQVTTALELDGVGVVENPARIPLPAMSVNVHRGLVRDVDVGGKLSVLPLGDAGTALGFEGQGRWRFLGDEHARLELAFAPSAGWRGIESSGARWDAAHVVAPLVAGLNLGARRHQLYLAPKVGWQRWWSAGSMPIDVPFGGVTLGFAWRVRRTLTVLPEVSALRTPTTLDNSDGAAIVHLGIGLVIDGR